MTGANPNGEGKIRDLTVDNLTPHVVKTCTQNVSDKRTAELVTGLVQHLHDYVREVQLKSEEWEAGWRYLTEVREVHSCLQSSVLVGKIRDRDRWVLGFQTD